MRGNIGVVAVVLIVVLLFRFSGSNGSGDPKHKAPSRRALTMPNQLGLEIFATVAGFMSSRSGAFRLAVGKRVGIPVFLPASDSLMVFGPTRSGKTTSLVLPLLAQFNGPSVATSVKSDVYTSSREFRESIGRCELFDLSSCESSSWNIFSLVSDLASAKGISDVLCRVGKNRGGEMEFWSQLASKVLSSLILAAKELSPSLRTVFDWIESQDFEYALEGLYKTGQDEAQSALDAIVKMDPRTFTSVIATLLSLLEPYSDPAVSRLLSTDGINIESLLSRTERNTLYICSPMFKSERFAPIYEIFLSKVFEFAYSSDSEGARMLFLLDELANVAPIPDLDKIASTCGSFGIVLCSIFQDLAQVETAYGSRSRSVVNNHRSKLCLSGITDISTIDYISRITAESVKYETKSNPLQGLRLGQGLFVRSTERPLKIYLKPARQRVP